ncbi:uncharacterized protein LOC129592567 [Paramacrobiotus metropolitanus]|uniref:uncharacterized protein LOC129592567 n=1 Tax=Paramacrobiotus metropolitanus TaxID=2943436 RepID=UPI002446125D|nr:uncharacterized protein LOC129592567 [Paramacrobiotus metropolitanus]
MRSIVVFGLLYFAVYGMEVSALQCYVFLHLSTGNIFSRVETCELGEVCMVKFTKKSTNAQDIEPYRTCWRITAEQKLGCSGIGSRSHLTCYCNTDGCNAEWAYTTDQVNAMLAPAHRPTVCWLSFTVMMSALLMVP